MKPSLACWTLAFCLALGSATPSHLRAQVPTVQNQPRLAVPVTRAVVEQAPSSVDTAAAQPPGQPPAAPAPQPVTQVTGATGVTPLPSSTESTASSSQAAT